MALSYSPAGLQLGSEVSRVGKVILQWYFSNERLQANQVGDDPSKKALSSHEPLPPSLQIVMTDNTVGHTPLVHWFPTLLHFLPRLATVLALPAVMLASNPMPPGTLHALACCIGLLHVCCAALCEHVQCLA